MEFSRSVMRALLGFSLVGEGGRRSASRSPGHLTVYGGDAGGRGQFPRQAELVSCEVPVAVVGVPAAAVQLLVHGLVLAGPVGLRTG